MYDNNQVHYVVVTGIIINKEGKYLITKRSEFEKAFGGKWTVPGGKLKVLDYALRKKDTPEHWYNVLEDVLKREVIEEVGLQIKDIGYVTSMVYIRPDNVPCIIISLFAYAINEDVRLNHEMSEFAWVGLKEAQDYDLISGIFEELEILDKYLKSGKMSEWKNNK